MSRRRSIWVLAVLCAAVGLVVTSITSLYVASAEVARDTGASETDLTWIIDAYTLVMAGLLMPAGALGDRFGRREVMIVGLVIAAMTSPTIITSRRPKRSPSAPAGISKPAITSV